MVEFKIRCPNELVFSLQTFVVKCEKIAKRSKMAKFGGSHPKLSEIHEKFNLFTVNNQPGSSITPHIIVSYSGMTCGGVLESTFGYQCLASTPASWLATWITASQLAKSTYPYAHRHARCVGCWRVREKRPIARVFEAADRTLRSLLTFLLCYYCLTTWRPYKRYFQFFQAAMRGITFPLL